MPETDDTEVAAPIVDIPNPEDMATVTVTGHTTDWNTLLWWAVAIGVGYYLLKEAKLT